MCIKINKILANKEPTSLVLQNGKRPDGATLISWSTGKALAWDVTVPDTYAPSHIQSTFAEACSAANAARSKIFKYHELSATHIFYPFSIETDGSWDAEAVKLTEEIGRRSAKTDDPNETMYLFHRISVAIQIQKVNAQSFTNTFDLDNT